jgi:hypothetical protein
MPMFRREGEHCSAAPWISSMVCRDEEDRVGTEKAALLELEGST